ncbi:glycoside hydrolase [Panaeolus papilionaceus]|nr:glycoside hydrolase [Panaeolus papilionaceus]
MVRPNNLHIRVSVTCIRDEIISADHRSFLRWTCVYSNLYHSQCLQVNIPSTAVGKLPALGWNSWNAYRCDVSDAKVMLAANAFVNLGLKDVGYEYVNIDDCWSQKNRDEISARLVPDPRKFPNGIYDLANRVHALGLKIGIYSDAGTQTCAGYPGSLGREKLDTITWSDWGIDYLKYDNCFVPSDMKDAASYSDWYDSNSAKRYRAMADALASTWRVMQYSLCIWGNAHVWEWGGRVGHSWRMSGDSSPTWSYISSIINLNAGRLSSTKFYAHNDMDMMEIGNGNLSIREQRTHFAAWIFMKSPILLGTDLTKLSTTQLSIIKNKELLAFHQDDTVGDPARPFTAYSGMPSTSPPEYYSGTSSLGTHVFIINTSGSTATKHFTFSNVPGLGTSGSFKLHDMWTGQDLSGTFTASSSYNVSVASHDTVAYRIIAV